MFSLREISQLAGKDTEILYNGKADEVFASEIVIDNRMAKAGTVFACIKGYARDGHIFAPSALKNGASALMTEDPELLYDILKENGWTDPSSVPVIAVSDIRLSIALCSAGMCGYPSEKMSLVGITGTKGKTTTSYMIRSILTAAGLKSGMIGTICNYVGDRRVETQRTTPEATVIQPLLKEMADEGIKNCVMEVSSQGLHLNRVAGCHFTTALWTNLSRDHIGESEHHNMNEYAEAKSRLFAMAERVLLNADNEWYGFMAEKAGKNENAKVYTYGIDSECDFRAVNIRKEPEHVEYDVLKDGNIIEHIFVPIPGKFSVYNSLASFSAMYLEGTDTKTIAEGLKNVFVPGKAEIVPTGKDFTVLIDYAHNPDSFINIITTVKEFAKRTVFLFGCGGDRNRPRFQMGETAGKYADFVIVTSDNPRTEDPASIVRDLEEGVKSTGADYIAIVDRRQAIHYAIKNALPGDVIILAGKGHETEQILKDRVIHFDEREVVAEALKELEDETEC